MIYLSTIQWFIVGGEYYTQPAEVKIDGKKIEVSAPNTSSCDEITFRGSEVEAGHYTLWEDGAIVKGLQPHATLHRLKKSDYLEGYYTCEGEQGMWRITLGKIKGKDNRKQMQR
ncbi:MAG: hypothetical protein WCG51_06210 [Elusimicrobiota bacterium]